MDFEFARMLPSYLIPCFNQMQSKSLSLFIEKLGIYSRTFFRQNMDLRELRSGCRWRASVQMEAGFSFLTAGMSEDVTCCVTPRFAVGDCVWSKVNTGRG